MNGGQDLGGMQGLGPINPEPEDEEPHFHAHWEGRAMAITLACGMLGRWNLDMARHARERQHPADYLKNTYYENWLAGLEKLLVETGLVTEEELKTGQVQMPLEAKPHAPDPAETKAIITKGASTEMDSGPPPRFKVGDKVRVRTAHTTGHTRAPRYARGHVGTVTDYYGHHVFADSHAQGKREGEPLYNVSFDGAELWGPDHNGPKTVSIDLWQPHLEPAE